MNTVWNIFALMSGTPYPPNRWLQYATSLMLLIGAGAYTYAYWYGRSLYLDEANLALVLETASFRELFLPLAFEQYAPPLFLIVAKVGLFFSGHHEWGLRLIPFLAALASLGAMFHLLRQLNWDWSARLFVLAWMAFSPHLMRYASECKQYSWDVLIIILLMSIVVRFRQYPPKGWSWIGPAFLFLFLPWASMPAIFLLGTWGGLEILEKYRNREFQKMTSWMVISLLGLGSFLLYYYLVIGTNLSNTLLLEYHRPYFMPWRMDQPGQLQHAFSLLNDLVAWAFGHTVISLLFGLCLCLTGLVVLLKKNRFFTFLVSGPIILALFASMAGYFTLIPRVNLFMIPLFLLLAGAGIQWLTNRLSLPFRPWITSLIWVLCLSSFIGKLPKLWQEPEIEDVHQVMIDLSDRRDQRPWYIHWNATPAYRYYTEFHVDRSRFAPIKVVPVPWTTPQAILSTVEQEDEFWMLFSHLISDQARQEQEQFRMALISKYDAIETIHTRGALAIRFQNRHQDRN